MGKNLTYEEFSAKLLLFGEYTVLTGSSSLAIPFSGYQFRFCNTRKNQFSGLVKSFYDFLKSIDFSEYDTTFYHSEFEKAFMGGLYFESNIPIGYGLGSSGAFTAAVYNKFFKKVETASPEELRMLFSAIENFFHGKSSGIDPLIIYLNQGIFRDKNKNIIPIDFNLTAFGNLSLSLINSGISRSTAHYVSIFNHKIGYSDFLENEIHPLSEINNKVISGLMEKGSGFDLFPYFKDISKRQFMFFKEMIPKNIYPIWEASLKLEDHAIKLCGAGGGGFFYLLSRDRSAFRQAFPKIEVINIYN